jgi:nucleoside-triphosphatase
LEKGLIGILEFWLIEAKSLEKRILVLTGMPSVGKTTVLARTVGELRARGVSVGGMFSREVREGAARVGFEIIDVNSGSIGWLAHVKLKGGPQVGKYQVNLKDLENIGVRAITNALETSDVVVIDEIGPMELLSQKFKDSVRKALESNKLIIAIIHQKIQDSLIVEAKNREDAQVFVITPENRVNFHLALVEKSVAFFRSQSFS